MISVLLLSHGEMAKGMLNSCKLFFGEHVPKVEALCLMEEDSPEAFDDRINEAIDRLNDGSGVMIFCDLMGGTPSNRCMRIVNDQVACIAGANLAVVIEFLGMRFDHENINQIDINALIDVAQNGIKNLNKVVKDFSKKED